MASPDTCQRHHSAAVTLALIPCLALTIVLGLLSDGAYHDDDLTHFLMARWARWHPEYLLHIWGRPGLTVPLAAVAWFADAHVAWHAARILSALVTAATALLAARLAVRLGIRNAWLVVVACYLQPLSTLLACTTLTETFAAFYLIAAVALLYAKRPVAASAVLSLALLTRHEALVFLPIWWLGLLGARATPKRKAAACLIALWAPTAHNLIFRLTLRGWPVGIFFAPHGSTEYPATGLLNYLPHALHAVPPTIAGLALVGGIAFLRRGRLLIPAFAAVFFLTHVAIRTLGAFASGGYARFMVVVTPFVAILAVAGYNTMKQRLNDRRPNDAWWFALGVVWPIGLTAFEIERRAGRIQIHDMRFVWLLWATAAIVVALILTLLATSRSAPSRRWTHRRNARATDVSRRTLSAITATVLALTCAIQWVCVVRPLSLRKNEQQVRRVIGWLEEQRLVDAPLFATNPWFAYFLNLVEHPRAHKDARLLASMPVDTVFLWDSIYSHSDYHRLKLKTFQDDGHYQLLETFPGSDPGVVEVYAFRKIVETPVPPEPKAFYPPDLMSAEKPFSGIYYIRPDDH